MSIRIELPPVKSSANLREHWAVRASRVSRERSEAKLVTPALRDFRGTVTFTRRSPKELDDDNLRSACKAVRDGIADKLGINDGDPRIKWEYEQVFGKPALFVEFERDE